jgi:hypothetical protein
VVIGPSITVPPLSKLTTKEAPEDDDQVELQEIDLGNQGVGELWIKHVR